MKLTCMSIKASVWLCVIEARVISVVHESLTYTEALQVCCHGCVCACSVSTVSALVVVLVFQCGTSEESEKLNLSSG